MTHDDIVKSVITLLGVDSDLNKHEMRFLDDLCKRLEVSAEVRKKAILRLKKGKGSVHLPEDEADRKRLMYFLIQAVASDGKVDPNERKVLDVVAKNFGVSEEEIEGFLRSRLDEVKKDLYTSKKKRPQMECPKCGFKQPKGHKCKRCGIIFSKYKEVHGPTDEDRLMEILASSNKIQMDEE